jgi:hypothetical protein
LQILSQHLILIWILIPKYFYMITLKASLDTNWLTELLATVYCLEPTFTATVILNKI